MHKLQKRGMAQELLHILPYSPQIIFFDTLFNTMTILMLIGNQGPYKSTYVYLPCTH